MKVIRGHVICLNPNNKQITYFKKACGVARFSYNWALAEWKRQYEEYQTYRNDCLNKNIPIDKTKLNKPSEGKLRKQLNAIKHEQFSFMLEVTKCSPQLAIMQLGDAFKRFLMAKVNIQNSVKKA